MSGDNNLIIVLVFKINTLSKIFDSYKLRRVMKNWLQDDSYNLAEHLSHNEIVENHSKSK